MNRQIESEVQSKALHVVYRSDQVSFPIKLTHDDRSFDLNMYVFSTKELKKDLSAMHNDRKSVSPYQDDHLHPFLDSILRNQKGYLTLYSAAGTGFGVGVGSGVDAGSAGGFVGCSPRPEFGLSFSKNSSLKTFRRLFKKTFMREILSTCLPLFRFFKDEKISKLNVTFRDLSAL